MSDMSTFYVTYFPSKLHGKHSQNSFFCGEYIFDMSDMSTFYVTRISSKLYRIHIFFFFKILFFMENTSDMGVELN